MIKRSQDRFSAYRSEIVFHPALTPMEAAVLPAGERRQPVGALRMARAMFDFDRAQQMVSVRRSGSDTHSRQD